jgi:hypothetical protein
MRLQVLQEALEMLKQVLQSVWHCWQVFVS